MSKCAHCGTPKAEATWDLTLCADERKPRARKLCGECDAQLNLLILKFFNDPKAEVKMRRYKERNQGAAHE